MKDANGESDLSVDGHKFYYGPSPWTWDWDGMVAANSGSASDVVVFQTDTVSRGDGESIGVLRNSTNIQKVSGLVTKFDYDFSSELSFGAGLDYRWADIYHVKYIRDLLGGNYCILYVFFIVCLSKGENTGLWDGILCMNLILLI